MGVGAALYSALLKAYPQATPDQVLSAVVDSVRGGRLMGISHADPSIRTAAESHLRQLLGLDEASARLDQERHNRVKRASTSA